MYSREVAATAAINTAQTQYHSQFNRYAPSLTVLGPPDTGSPNAFGADIIGKYLASGKKQG
jgi:type IV pilus assembly protein PilA